jgi:hypothetical protein
MTPDGQLPAAVGGDEGPALPVSRRRVIDFKDFPGFSTLRAG